MRIAFFGSSLVSAYWNGAATYYRGILKGLAALGHDITFYEPDAFDRQQHRDIPDPAWARVVVYPPDEAGAAAALEDAASAEVVVKASGVGVLDDWLEREVLALRRPGRAVVYWDVDAPATLAAVEDDPRHPLRALIPRYDMVFTYGGGPPVVTGYEAAGARACVPVYNALDPEEHHPAPAEPAYACDLLFLGNRMPDRESRVEEFFLRPALRLPERRFLLGGSGWETKALPPNVRRLGHVSTRDHNILNCSARAVLNVNRDSMARIGHSPPTRIFEAAGAGACILSDAWPGIDAFLEPGREILLAQDGFALAEQLAGLSPTRAAAIGRAARRRVLAEHTYARRAAQVDAVLTGRKGIDTGREARAH